MRNLAVPLSWEFHRIQVPGNRGLRRMWAELSCTEHVQNDTSLLRSHRLMEQTTDITIPYCTSQCKLVRTFRIFRNDHT